MGYSLSGSDATLVLMTSPMTTVGGGDDADGCGGVGGGIADFKHSLSCRCNKHVLTACHWAMQQRFA